MTGICYWSPLEIKGGKAVGGLTSGPLVVATTIEDFDHQQQSNADTPD